MVLSTLSAKLCAIESAVPRKGRVMCHYYNDPRLAGVHEILIIANILFIKFYRCNCVRPYLRNWPPCT